MEQLELPADLLTGWRRPATDARARITELRGQGLTFDQIAFRLNTERVSTPTGRGRWYRSTVHRHANPQAWAGYMRAYRARHDG